MNQSHIVNHVLDGYLILDFTRYVAGPTCTLMMAEMGAEVIKLEPYPNGDGTRTYPFLRNGRSGYFVQHNRGKQSVCVNLKTPEGIALVRELISKVDVVVENYAPGVMAKMGLSYDAINSINPRIVMCSISAFGQTGPLSSRPGYDMIGQAYAGITSMCGEPGDAPYFPMAAIGDVSTGVHAMAAVVCALLYRERTGKGQYLDISLLDSYFHCNDSNVEVQSLCGSQVKVTRSGRQAYDAPDGIFRGKQRYFFIIASDAQWPALCEAMGRPELARDPRFVDMNSRYEHLDALTAVVEEWFAEVGDDIAMERLEHWRVPFAPVLSVEEAMNHPHLRARGTVRKVRDRILGELDLPGFALRFSDFKVPLELHAPFLGEHNEPVLARLLEMSPEQVKNLEERGVLNRGST